MAIKIRLIRNHIKCSSSYGKYFAKTVSQGEVTLAQLTEEASRNTTLKKSEVLAVVIELEDMMRQQLAGGQTIVLDGIGRISLRVESECVYAPQDFDLKKHIKRVVCRFLPAADEIRMARWLITCPRMSKWSGRRNNSW